MLQHWEGVLAVTAVCSGIRSVCPGSWGLQAPSFGAKSLLLRVQRQAFPRSPRLTKEPCRGAEMPPKGRSDACHASSSCSTTDRPQIVVNCLPSNCAAANDKQRRTIHQHNTAHKATGTAQHRRPYLTNQTWRKTDCRGFAFLAMRKQAFLRQHTLHTPDPPSMVHLQPLQALQGASRTCSIDSWSDLW